MVSLKFSRSSRVMLLAPHPDDEVLGGGISLQRAVHAGAAIRVIYATDGEDNPWPQRAMQRKWRVTDRDQARWGRLRRMEARAALRVLGVPRGCAQFCGLPDQGLKPLLKRRPASLISLFLELIVSWQPTVLLVPSITDTHADHRALGIAVGRIALLLRARLPKLAIWSYHVHGRRTTFLRHAVAIDESAAEAAVKVAALRCHRSQLALSERRFLRYATRGEQLVNLLSPSGVTTAPPPVRPVTKCRNIRKIAGAAAFIERRGFPGGVRSAADRIPACAPSADGG